MEITIRRVKKSLQKIQALFKSSKNGKFAAKWILAEKDIKHRMLVTHVVLPIGVRHRDLVHIYASSIISSVRAS